MRQSGFFLKKKATSDTLFEGTITLVSL